MKKANDVAKVLLKLSDPDLGDVLTNLKLQKLLYYVQGFHLAINNKALFQEDIIHWEYGPIVREVYNKYSKCEGGAIDVPENFAPATIFSPSELNLISEVNKVYGQFSAWKLVEMTHQEKPWKNTKSDEVISVQAMKEFFTTLIA